MSEPLLRVSQVTMDFSGLRALHQVDFEAEEGMILGIIGPNGAGKTTLFNIIAGDQAPSRGQILIAGQNTTRLPPDRICRLGVSRTYQSVRPFHGLSVADNLRVALYFGRRGERLSSARAEEEVRALLDFVGLDGLAEKRAERLVPILRKRLELARALAVNPRLLLLDEIIAGLTPTETREMMQTIRAINARGITVLMIEHVIKAVMGLSNRIIVLHHGEKIAEGDPGSVSADPFVIQAYLGAHP